MIGARRPITLFIVTIMLVSSLFVMIDMDESFHVDGSIAFEDDKRVVQDITGSPQRASCILVSQNDVYVFWQDRRNGNWDIYSSASHNGGLSFGPEVRVDDTSRTPTLADDISEQRAPRGVFGPNGEIYVVWEDDRLGKPMIYYAVSTDKGASFSSNALISDSVIGEQRDPDIDSSPSGDLYVAWEDNRDNMGTYQIYSSHMLKTENTFSDAIRVSDVSTQYDCKDPSVASPADGLVHVVWNDDRVWDEDIYISTSRNGGDSFEGSLRVSADPTGSDQTGAEIAADEGAVYVLWSDPRTNSADIYYAVSRDNATTFSVNKVLNPRNNSGHQYQPRAALDDAGNLTACWTSSPGLKDTKSDVQMTKLSWNGTLEEVYTVNDPVPDVTQLEPDVAVNDRGGSFFVWTDNRNSLDDDIYFTRTTVSGEEGFAPVITDHSVSPEVGGIGYDFTFKATYMDRENDAPSPGYPKVNLFYRSAANILYPFPGSPFNMSRILIPRQDLNYYNGEDYIVSLKIKRNLDLFYSISAQASTGNSTIVQTDMRNLPIIDDEGPRFKIVEPEPGQWVKDNIIPLQVIITDDLSGVEPWSIFYQKYQSETGGWGSWQRKGMSVPIDNSSVLYSVNVTLLEGKDNMIRFRAMDKIQYEINDGRYSISEDHRIWVDPSGPRIDVISPSSGNVQNSTDVTFRAYLEDKGSGLDPDSIEVSYSLTGVDNFGMWSNLSDLEGELEEEGDGHQLEFNLSLAYGFNNHVRIRARDQLGNIGSSGNVQVIIQKEDKEDDSDKPPSKVESIQPKITGSIRPHITWTPSFDPEGALVTYNLSVYDQTDGRFLAEGFQVTPGFTYWDPSQDQLFTPGHTYTISIVPSARGLEGPQTNSTLLVSTDANHPPDPVTNLTPRATSDTTPVLSWDPSSDPDGDEVYYFLRIGTYSSGSDILGWTSLLSNTRYSVKDRLSPGTYYIDVFSSDGKDFAPISHFTVSIGIYNPVLELQRSQLVVYQGSGATMNLTIFNKGFTYDNIKTRVDGEPVHRADLEIRIGKDRMDLAPGSGANTTLHVDASESAKVGIFSLNITLVSVDGLSTYTKGVSIRVVDPDDPYSGLSPSGEDEEEDNDTLILLVLFIVLLLVIIGAMGYAYYRIDRREREQEVEIVEGRKGPGLGESRRSELGSGKEKKGKALPPKR
ncbi:MAG: hypothetical protein R6V01_00020 [Thermoplasmatota archaeon]